MIGNGAIMVYNIGKIKGYNRDFAPHRIDFNVHIVGRKCTVCEKGRPPLPYTILDADSKPVCLKCAKENKLPIASAFEAYERSIEIFKFRLMPDELFPYTGLFYTGILKKSPFDSDATDWFARGLVPTVAKYSIDMVYYFFDNNNSKPLLAVGIRGSVGNAQELLERAEMELLAQIEETKELLKNKIAFFYLLSAPIQPGEIPYMRNINN
jgi:hypothetical protein